MRHYAGVPRIITQQKETDVKIDFKLPKNEIIDMIVQSYADDLASAISDPCAAVDVDLDQCSVTLDLEIDTQAQGVDNIALERLRQQYSTITMKDIADDWVNIVVTMPIPSEITRLLTVIREIADVTYTLPPEIDKVCAAGGILTEGKGN